jgi:hypothetical protein
MPFLFGTKIVSVLFNNSTGIITVTGEAFGESIDPICNIEYSVRGTGIWNSVASINLWTDTMAIGAIGSIPLEFGNYDVRITSSDGEVSPVMENAIKIIVYKGSSCWISAAIGI